MNSDQHLDAGQPAPGVRASDAERERTVAQLNQHVVDGRLTTDEFSERVEAAYSARTRPELDVLLADLPSPAAPTPAPPERQDAWRPPRFPVIVLALLALTVFAGWIVGMATGWTRGPGFPFPFFPLIPLLFWGFVLARLASWGARRR